MFRKISACIIGFLLLVNMYGCVALLTGTVAGGAGTAVWLSGKLTQYVDASLEQVEKAVKDSLPGHTLKIVIRENAAGETLVQIRSRYSGGEKIYIDIHRISALRSRIEVRVRTVISDKKSAERILKGITERL